MSDSNSTPPTGNPTEEPTATAPADTPVASPPVETPGASPEGAAAPSATGAPASSGSKKWYIVHTYSGQEARAKQGLLERAAALGFEEKFDEILIPEESVVEMVKGQKRNMKRKFFPGYILAKMELSDEAWNLVKNTQRVTGFLGGQGRPVPISEREAKDGGDGDAEGERECRE